MKYTVQTKFIGMFVLFALVPLGLLAFLNGLTAQQALIDDANQALFAVAAQTADSVDNFIRANQVAIETEANLPALSQYLNLPPEQRAGSEAEQQILDLLQALSRKDPTHITSYALLDNQGISVANTVAAELGLDKSNRDYFTHFLSANVTDPAYVSPILVAPTTGKAALYF